MKNNENALAIGKTLANGRYRITGVLGEGGFGITYQATSREKVSGNIGQMDVEIPVAIKEFFMKENCDRDISSGNVSVPSSASHAKVDRYRQKFIKEAHSMAKLNHPNIVHVADVFEENQTVYYVMQYLRGGSLRSYIDKHGAMSEGQAVRYIRQIAEALEYMHTEHNMCHFDVKPGNIMLDDRNNAMLIDFGISKSYDNTGHETSDTPPGLSKGYAPLEQYNQSLQDFSPVTDIYSLGATLYAILTGKNPPEASIVNEQGLGEKPASISDRTWNAIEKAMQPIRKNRPQQMTDFIACLDGTDNKVEKEYPDSQENEVTVTVGNFGESDETQTSEEEGVVIEPVVPDASDVSPEPEPDPLPSSHKKWLIPLVLAIVLGVAAFIAYPHILGREKMVENYPVYGPGGNVAFHYTGPLVKGFPEGKGKAIYTDQDKDTYTGHFVAGNRNDTFATLTFKNGDKYEGSFVNDLFGEGSYIMKKDGSYFKGTFKDFQPYNGTWYDVNGKIIVRVVDGEEKAKK